MTFFTVLPQCNATSWARVMTAHPFTLYRQVHWVDTWWANGDVSPSQIAVVDRLDLKISDYIQSKSI